MFFNPFIEGIIVIVLGIGTVIAGSLLKIPDLGQYGQLLVPLGIGYMGGNKVGQSGATK